MSPCDPGTHKYLYVMCFIQIFIKQDIEFIWKVYKYCIQVIV